MENSAFALPQHYVFGGFWVRFAAIVVDSICMLVPLIAAFVLGSAVVAGWESDAAVGVFMTLLLVISVAWSFLYFILSYGIGSTTPGKMLFGMRVVRADNGQRMSWAQAFGRSFAYVLSRIFYIGFLIAALDEEKRALHDYLAKTRVIRDTQHDSRNGWIVVALCVVFVCIGIGFMVSLPALLAPLE